MNSGVFSVPASFLLAFGIGAGLIGVASVNAQIPDIPGMPSTISGAYLNTEAGVGIVFPEGWEGFEISAGGSTIASVSQGGLDTSGDMSAAMSLIISDKTEVEQEPDLSEPQNVPEDSTVDCDTATVSNVNVAGVTALESVVECTVDGTAIKGKTVMVDTESRWVVVSFMAPSEQYDENIGAVDNSIGTLEVDGAVDVEGIPDVGIDVGLTPMTQTVSVAGEDIDVSIRTSSDISDFQLDEESMSLSFTVEGDDGTEGATEIAIGRVLEGPYTVTIDGQATTDFEVTEASGETMITISYTHSVHEVIVTGTNVVPEFPVAIMAAVAAVIGAVALLSRTRLMGGFTAHRT